MITRKEKTVAIAEVIIATITLAFVWATNAIANRQADDIIESANYEHIYLGGK